VSNLLPVTVVERAEGSPGIVESDTFDILINLDEVTLVNQGEDPDVTFLRLTCGASLCAMVPYEDFIDKMLEAGVVILPPYTPKKTVKKKKASGKKK
jgi:hypothetical protein